jgi:hypothetical protein
MPEQNKVRCLWWYVLFTVSAQDPFSLCVYHGALGVNGVEQRVHGVRCDVFCTTSPRGVVLSFVPTSIFSSLCSILPYKLITGIRKKFVVGYM